MRREWEPEDLIACWTLVDYLKKDHTLDEFLEGFPTFSREQAEAYLESTLEATDATTTAGRS